MRIPLFIPIALILALATPAGAYHCTTYSTSSPEVDAGGYYFEDDNFVFCYLFLQPTAPENICSFWVYEESNGIPGLQRGDEVVDDTCHGMIAADTIIL